MNDTSKKPVRVNGELFSELLERTSDVPEHMKGGLLRYVEDRIKGGSFMTALLSNDLLEAAKRADEVNAHMLFEWCRFLYNHAPPACYGSAEKVRLWLAERKIES